jgi:hypothetical protein
MWTVEDQEAAFKAQWKRQLAQASPEQIEEKRQLCKIFEFWRNCERKLCARARACGGNPFECNYRGWDQMPRAKKDAIIVAIRARLGCKPGEELRAAEALLDEEERCKEEQRRRKEKPRAEARGRVFRKRRRVGKGAQAPCPRGPNGL